MFKLKKRTLVIGNVLFFCFLLHFNVAFSQTEFFNSKLLIKDIQTNYFYSSMSVDSTQIYFNASNFNVYAFNKKTGELNWSHYSGYISNNPPNVYQNKLLIKSSDEKLVLLNTKNGNAIQTLKIEELTTQPFFKDDIMYCAAISPEIGGAVIAYDLKKNEIVWQKFIGHGVSLQPYFLNDKIVVNYQEQFWFELDYNGNALDKSKKCYSKNTEPPFEEQFCNIPYDVVNQFHKELTTRNVTIDAAKYYHGTAKYYYGTNETVVLKENELKIINQKNKIKKEIVIDKIITLPESGENSYSEILKVAENTIWFVYENILGVYDFKKNITLKAYDLSTWRPHKVILNGNTIWLISKINGELVALELEENGIDKTREEEAKLEKEKALRFTTPDKRTIEAKTEAAKKIKSNN